MKHLLLFESFLNPLHESTHKIHSLDQTIVLVSEWVINHIQTHNEYGQGSTFRKGISDGQILDWTRRAVSHKHIGEGGAFPLRVPQIGYNLVLPYNEALSLPDAEELTTEKTERGAKITVPLIRTSAPKEEFETDLLTLIIRPSNPQYLPPDLKDNPEILERIDQGKCHSLLTAFPGDPDIPPASQWQGKWAVVVPGS